jgi:hypothetical protein
MPRNPDKSRCHVSGCHNGSMSGHTHCRSHRDGEPDPSGGSVPQRHLNAPKTREHAHPLSPAERTQLAGLPAILDLLIRSIHNRTRGSYNTHVARHVAPSGLCKEVATVFSQRWMPGSSAFRYLEGFRLPAPCDDRWGTSARRARFCT